MTEQLTFFTTYLWVATNENIVPGTVSLAEINVQILIINNDSTAVHLNHMMGTVIW